MVKSPYHAPPCTVGSLCGLPLSARPALYSLPGNLVSKEGLYHGSAGIDSLGVFPIHLGE
jgi:hypothetical protein